MHEKKTASTTDQGESGVNTAGCRKPYVAPQILSREPLEVLATTCSVAGGGKADPIPGVQCFNFTQS